MYTILKCATSLDGFIDDASAERLLLSNSEDFARADRVRAESDAILVGAHTIRKDNPRLLLRSPDLIQERITRGKPPHPLKVTVTRSGNLESGARFFTEGDGEKLVLCPKGVGASLHAKLGYNVTVDEIESCTAQLIHEHLKKRGVERLLLEGGEKTIAQFLEADLIDEIQISIAPFLVGDSSAPRMFTPGKYPFTQQSPLQLKSILKVGEIVELVYLR